MSIESIHESEILKRVIKEISNTKKEINMTHFFDINKDSKLNTEYKKNIKNLISKGVICNRIIFYSKEIPEKIKLQKLFLGNNFKNPEFKNHQRMILIDDKKLFFSIEKKNLEIFFFTQDLFTISVFKNYFIKSLKFSSISS